MGFLVVFEVSKKQHYIFKSNKLKENIGASEIIEYVTEILPKELCKKNKGEEISSGGGSSILYFENREESRRFSEEYSIQLLKSFPSLEFFIASAKYDRDKDRIISKIRDIYGKLEEKKAKRNLYAYIMDFGVSEKCSSTRLPAVDRDNNRFVSAEIKSKIDMYNQKENDDEQYAIDIKDLGISKNDKSYIAITHIDGNRMGKRVNSLIEKFESKYTSENVREVNDQYLKEYKEFSEQIKIAFENAFERMVEVVKDNLESLKNAGLSINKNVLPIRKVVLAGDDVCYITDARIALECANIFIRELEKHYFQSEKITACAGIAMVKEKYPFFKTYELSEDLCKNAKGRIDDSKNQSRIDWHIVQGEYNNNLIEIRETAYVSNDGKELILRPLVVSKDFRNEQDSYTLFKEDMRVIRNMPHGKVKGMLKEMKKGERELDTYIEINKLYRVLGEHRLESKTGFRNNKCILFDAIEAMDYFVSIVGEEE